MNNEQLFRFRFIDEQGRLYKGSIDKRSKRGKVTLTDEDGNDIRKDAPVGPHVVTSIMATLQTIRHEICLQNLIGADETQTSLEMGMFIKGGPTHVLPRQSTYGHVSPMQ